MKKYKTNNNNTEAPKQVDYAARRKRAEGLASIGMLLIAGGILVPLFNLLNPMVVESCKWVFAAGTLLFFAGRCIPVSSDDESIRLKRMRRMEFWSGACFLVAAFFWFYNESRYAGTLAQGASAMTILRDTVVFSMAGAVLQVVASWLIYFREKKEKR